MTIQVRESGALKFPALAMRGNAASSVDFDALEAEVDVLEGEFDVLEGEFDALNAEVITARDGEANLSAQLNLRARKTTVIAAAGLATGGGDLSGTTRTIDVPAASGAETLARILTTKAVTPLGLDAALDPIDAAVAALTSEVVEARSGYSDLDARLDATADSVEFAVLQADFDAIEAEIVTAREGSASLDAKLDIMESAALATTNEVIAARGGRANLDGRLDEMETEVITARSGQASLDVRIDAIAATAGSAASDAEFTALQSEVVTARSGSETLDDRLDADRAGWSATTNEVVTARSGAVSLDARIDAVATRWEATTTEVQTAREGHASLDARLDADRTLAGEDVALARKELLTEPAVSELASLWSATVTGEPAIRPELSTSSIVFDGQDGLVLQVTGGAVRAPRAAYRMLPGHKYEVIGAARRKTMPLDPLGDSVDLRAEWLTSAKAHISEVALTAADPLPTSSLKLFRAVVALTAGDEVDIVAPAGTVYFTPLMRTFGSDGVTNILPIIRVTDLTSNTLVSADIAGLDARIAAIESEDLANRMVVVESALAAPELAQFKTRDIAETISIGATVDMVRTGGRLVDDDGLGRLYVDSAGEPDSYDDDKWQSLDGRWWGVIEDRIRLDSPNVQPLRVREYIEAGEWPLTAWGAVGDGVTDDLPAIMNAIASGEKLLGPRGTFLIDGSILITPACNGLELRGKGMAGATTFKSADFAHSPVISFSGGTAEAPILDIHLSEFKIDGNKDNMTDGQSSSRGIYMSGGGTVQRRFHFHRIWMDKVLDQGFNVAGGAGTLEIEETDSLVDYCRASNGGRETHISSGGAGGSGFTGGGLGLKLHKCVSEDNYLSGFKFQGFMDSCIARRCGSGYTSGSLNINTEVGPYYVNCIGEYCEYGWYIRGQADKTILMGCIARYNDSHGILIGDDTRGVLIGGGTRIYNNGQKSGIEAPIDIFGGWNGIYFNAGTIGGPVEVIIDDTMIYDNQKVKTQDFGIQTSPKSLRCVVGDGCVIGNHKIQPIYRSGHIHVMRVKNYSGSPLYSSAPFIGNVTTPLITNPFTTLINSRTVTVAHTAHGRAINEYVNIADRSGFVTLPLNPLSTTNGSATVTLTDAAHGAVVGETVEIRTADAVGGITVFGNYLVASVPTADTLTIAHSAPATSTATGGGDGVNVAYRSIVGGLHINGRFRIQSVPNANSYTIWHEANATATVTGGGAGVTGNYATTAPLSHTGTPGSSVRLASFVIPPDTLVVGAKFKVVATGTMTGTTCAKRIAIGTGTTPGASGIVDEQPIGVAEKWWGEATFVCDASNSVRGLIAGGHTGGVSVSSSTTHALTLATQPINILLIVEVDPPGTDTITMTTFSISADE